MLFLASDAGTYVTAWQRVGSSSATGVLGRELVPQLPMTTAAGRALDSGDYPELLERLERAADYGALRQLQAEAFRIPVPEHITASIKPGQFTAI